jgi:Leucine-rich repeat (LRR) protein
LTATPLPAEKSKPRLQAGGTLNPRRDLYIERPDDTKFLRLLSEGQYVNVLTSRQMGKSSLMVRTAEVLTRRGVRCAIVDLAAELGTPRDATAYFLGLLNKIARDLKINVDLPTWWAERSDETMNQRLMRFFREVVLERVPGQVVCFLDEIDSTLKLPWTDDLFTALRGIHNERPMVAAYERLTFCLIGVAWPNELIKDRRTTPYNVGSTLELRDFELARDDLTPLISALGANPEQGRPLIERVLYWTGGHPYLTARLCAALREIGAQAPEDVDRRVDDGFRSLERVSGDVHFQQVLRFLEARLSDGLATFNLYQRILDGKRERDQTTPAHAELKLSGLVKRDEEGCLVVRNRIYERLFDRHWVETTKPKRALAEYRRWAIAASVALLALIAAGGTYYGTLIYPEQQRLAALDALAARNITLNSGDTGIRIVFPKDASQSVLEETAPSLKLVGRVTDLSLAGAPVVNIASLASLTDLQALDLSGTQVSDITPVASLLDLRRLNLLQTPVSNLDPIATLTRLQWLEIGGTQIKDLNAAINLVNLEYLGVGTFKPELDRTLDLYSQFVTAISISDFVDKIGNNDRRTSAIFKAAPVQNIEALKNLTRLKWLDLAGTAVNDLRPIENLDQIIGLAVGGTAIPDVASIGNLINLEILDFSNTNVENVASLTNLSKLKAINISGARVSDVTSLADLRHLAYLILSNTKVANVLPLSSLTKVRALNLAKTQVTDIAPLTALPNIKLLDLSYLKLTQENLALVGALAGLRALSLSNTGLTDGTPLSDLTSLQMLDLSDTHIADAAPLANLTNLENLNLSGTLVRNVAALINLTKLRLLDLDRTKTSAGDIAALKSGLADRGDRALEIRGP